MDRRIRFLIREQLKAALEKEDAASAKNAKQSTQQLKCWQLRVYQTEKNAGIDKSDRRSAGKRKGKSMTEEILKAESAVIKQELFFIKEALQLSKNIIIELCQRFALDSRKYINEIEAVAKGMKSQKRG